MKITIEIDDVTIRETHVQELIGKIEQTKSVDPQDQPACKARRFLLVDQNANIMEGVRWGDESVVLDHASQHCRDFHCRGHFNDWDEFKAGHPGCGIQWIDQEVAE